MKPSKNSTIAVMAWIVIFIIGSFIDGHTTGENNGTVTICDRISSIDKYRTN